MAEGIQAPKQQELKMGVLPGWDSIESTETIAHTLHITAVLVLGLLVIAEAMALIYDSRNHTLVGIAATNAEKKRENDADAAETRRRTEVEGLQKQLEDANKKVTNLQSQNVARRLSPEERQSLIKDLSNSPGQNADVFVTTSAWDGSEYGKDLLAALKEAKWNVPDAPAHGIIVGGDVVGVQIVVNPEVVSKPNQVSGSFADSINYLALHLTRLGQMPTPTVNQDSNIEYGRIQIRIGRIPPK